MGKLVDLTGKQFGRWEVISREGYTKDYKVRWLCVCACGTEGVVIGSNLTRGISQSCGCKHKDIVSLTQTTHGHSKGGRVTSEMRAWLGANRRCSDPTDKSYKDYGALGVRVAAVWQGPEGFQKFLDHIGPKPSPELMLDRKDSTKGYEPGNVRWATRQQQNTNQRRSLWVMFEGERLPLVEACQRAGVVYSTVGTRCNKYKQDAQEAFDSVVTKTTPTVYVVVEGGCVRYVSSTSERVKCRVVDLDGDEDAALLSLAESYTKIW